MSFSSRSSRRLSVDDKRPISSKDSDVGVCRDSARRAGLTGLLTPSILRRRSRTGTAAALYRRRQAESSDLNLATLRSLNLIASNPYISSTQEDEKDVTPNESPGLPATPSPHVDLVKILSQSESETAERCAPHSEKLAQLHGNIERRSSSGKKATSTQCGKLETTQGAQNAEKKGEIPFLLAHEGDFRDSPEASRDEPKVAGLTSRELRAGYSESFSPAIRQRRTSTRSEASLVKIRLRDGSAGVEGAAVPSPCSQKSPAKQNLTISAGANAGMVASALRGMSDRLYNLSSAPLRLPSNEMKPKFDRSQSKDASKYSPTVPAAVPVAVQAPKETDENKKPASIDISSGATFGLDDANGVFAVDPLIQLLYFVTTSGNLRVIAPEGELLVMNTLKHVLITKIICIPGVGRVLTYGEILEAGCSFRKYSSSQEFSLPRLAIPINKVPAPGDYQPGTKIVQVWDCSELFSAPRERSLNGGTTIKNISIPFAVTAWARVRHHKTVEPTVLYQRCRRAVSKEREDTSRRKSIQSVSSQQSVDSRSTIPSVSRAVSSERGSMACPSREDDASKLALAAKYFSHPDNSSFCSNNPANDSRWLILIGTDEGDVRLFDSYANAFIDYFIAYENVVNQLSATGALPAAAVAAAKLHGQTAPLAPCVVSLLPHSLEPRTLLVGYINAVIIEWDFVVHKVRRCFLPVPFQHLFPEMAKVQLRKDSSGNKDNGSEEGSNGLSSPGAPAICTLVPADYRFTCPLFLHQLAWHSSNTAFIAIVSPVSPQGSLQAPFTAMFPTKGSLPNLIVDLGQSIGPDAANAYASFAYWVPGLRSSQNASLTTLMRSDVQVLLCPIPEQVQQQIHKFYVSQTTDVNHHSSKLLNTQSANLWRISGSSWNLAKPLFRHGLMKNTFAPSPLETTVFTAELLIPQTQQSPTSAGYNFIASICGLRIPISASPDQGEEAGALVAAVCRLTKYLISGTYVLLFSESPVRSLVGTCVKLDGYKFDILNYIYPKLNPPLRTGMASASVGPGNDESDRDCDLVSETEISEDGYDESGDGSFEPWNTALPMSPFVVDWHTCCGGSLTSARFIQKRTVLTKLSSAHCDGKIVADRSLTKLYSSEYLTPPESIDAACDALLTTRKRRAVHAWLSLLLGKPKSNLACFIDPKSQRDRVKRAKQATPSDLSSVSTDKSSCSPEEEWAFLNELPGLGDLIRLPANQVIGILATGHDDGYLRLWAMFSTSMPLLIHSLSTTTLHCPLSGKDTPEMDEDYLIVGRADSKPAWTLRPENPAIVALDILVTPLARIIAASCASGEILVFWWYSEATEIVAPYLAPFGFRCVASWKQQRNPIVSLQLVAFGEHPVIYRLLVGDVSGGFYLFDLSQPLPNRTFPLLTCYTPNNGEAPPTSSDIERNTIDNRVVSMETTRHFCILRNEAHEDLGKDLFITVRWRNGLNRVFDARSGKHIDLPENMNIRWMAVLKGSNNMGQLISWTAVDVTKRELALSCETPGSKRTEVSSAVVYTAPDAASLDKATNFRICRVRAALQVIRTLTKIPGEVLSSRMLLCDNRVTFVVVTKQRQGHAFNVSLSDDNDISLTSYQPLALIGGVDQANETWDWAEITNAATLYCGTRRLQNTALASSYAGALANFRVHGIHAPLSPNVAAAFSVMEGRTAAHINQLCATYAITTKMLKRKHCETLLQGDFATASISFFCHAMPCSSDYRSQCSSERPPSGPKSKWRTSIMKKLTQWSNEYIQEAPYASLRLFVTNPKRDCLVSAREERWRNRSHRWGFPNSSGGGSLRRLLSVADKTPSTVDTRNTTPSSMSLTPSLSILRASSRSALECSRRSTHIDTVRMESNDKSGAAQMTLRSFPSPHGTKKSDFWEAAEAAQRQLQDDLNLFNIMPVPIKDSAAGTP